MYHVLFIHMVTHEWNVIILINETCNDSMRRARFKSDAEQQHFGVTWPVNITLVYIKPGH